MGGTGKIIDGLEKLMKEENIKIIKGHKVSSIISNNRRIFQLNLITTQKSRLTM